MLKFRYVKGSDALGLFGPARQFGPTHQNAASWPAVARIKSGIQIADIKLRTWVASPQLRRIAAFHLAPMMGCWKGILSVGIAMTCGCCGALAGDAQVQTDAPLKIACGGETVAH